MLDGEPRVKPGRRISVLHQYVHRQGVQDTASLYETPWGGGGQAAAPVHSRMTLL